MKEKGQSLIELLMAMALCAILIPALLTAMMSTREGRAQQEQRTAAIAILRGDYEAVKSVKENSWTDFAKNGIYHMAIVDNFWKLESGAINIDGFNRSILISDVYRDVSGNIVTTGGNLDPSTKKVMITISWGTPRASAIDLPIYLTRYKSLLYKETLEAEFNQGIKTKVVVTKTDDGEVVLGAGGFGNWCEPNLSIAAIDLPKSGVANAITAIEGRVFAGTGNNSAGVSFANVSISNESPPRGSIEGEFDGYKTNGVFGESNYAYLATDNNDREVVIIDLTRKDENGKYIQIGYFNPSEKKNGKSVFVSGNIGYVTVENNLYTFDLSEKSGERTMLGGVALSGFGTSVKVNGNFAYVATDSTDKQLDIVEVKNGGRDLEKVGWAKLEGLEARDLVINDGATKAYMVTKKHVDENPIDDKKEFFIVDISTKTEGRPTLGSFDSDQMDPKAVVLATNNKAVMVGTGGEEYQVIEIGTDANLSKCGSLDIDTGINGAATVIEQDGDAFAYIITGDADLELKIIEGGPGGRFSQSGIFESRTFVATTEAAFNKFEATITKPASTDLTFQIAVVKADDCGSANYVFVGPDGTESTFFTTAVAIPFNTDGAGFENPGNCMRYRAYLSSTDRNQTPVLSDITINYSP